MNPGVIAFIVIYCVVLCCYFYTETTGNLKLRAPNKTILALMFFIFGAVVFTLDYKKFNFASYQVLLMLGLFFAAMGDIFLLVSLNRGGDFFLAGNVCFAVYYMCLLNKNKIYFESYWWVILIVAFMVIFVFLTSKCLPNFLKFGKMKYPMLFYLTSITLHGVMAMVTIGFLGKQGLSIILMGSGSILFMISDYVLTTDKFIFLQKNKWCLRLNSLTYFVGMLLIVLSMLY